MPKSEHCFDETSCVECIKKDDKEEETCTNYRKDIVEN